MITIFFLTSFGIFLQLLFNFMVSIYQYIFFFFESYNYFNYNNYKYFNYNNYKYFFFLNLQFQIQVLRTNRLYLYYGFLNVLYLQTLTYFKYFEVQLHFVRLTFIVL